MGDRVGMQKPKLRRRCDCRNISNLVTPSACTSTPTAVMTPSMVTVAPSSVPDDCPASKYIYLMHTVWIMNL